MNGRNLGRALVFLGIAAIILSMGWWAWYYNEVIRALGANPSLVNPTRCLFWTNDLCAQAVTTAKLANLPAYNPIAFWASIVVLVVGLGVVWRSTSTEPYPVTPASEPRLFISKLEPFYAWTRDLSWPIIRVAVAGTLFVHGFGKLTGATVAAFASGSLSRRGLEPSLPLAYVVYFNEGIGTILVALGLFTRFAAASIAIEMFVLMVAGHFANGFSWTSPRGGWQMPLVWGLIYFAIALRGGGPYSLDRLLRREL